MVLLSVAVNDAGGQLDVCVALSIVMVTVYCGLMREIICP